MASHSPPRGAWNENEMLEAIQSLGLPVDSGDLLWAILVVVLGACGTYLLLPHAHAHAKPLRVHATGGALLGLSILLLAGFWHPVGPLVERLFFYAFGIAAMAGGALMVTCRNPVYSALWFAAVVLATAGLFLLAGAQFLAAGTVIVYAGAIIVTFLFVIMLAQIQGLATYDRMARAPRAATFSCFLLLWGLLYALLLVRPVLPGRGPVTDATEQRLVRSSRLLSFYKVFDAQSFRALVLTRANRATAWLPEARRQGADTPAHVASLGATLYTDHLIAAELAGVLLFVALVGAVAIVAHKGAGGSAARSSPSS
jgi:NADH-quinone oxidoreductase subunit J